VLNSDSVPHNPEICTKYSSFIAALYIYVSCASICFSCEFCDKVPDLSRKFIQNLLCFLDIRACTLLIFDSGLK